MKTQETSSELFNCSTTLKVWSVPEIKILSSENTESGKAGPTFDGGTPDQLGS